MVVDKDKSPFSTQPVRSGKIKDLIASLERNKGNAPAVSLEELKRRREERKRVKNTPFPKHTSTSVNERDDLAIISKSKRHHEREDNFWLKQNLASSTAQEKNDASKEGSNGTVVSQKQEKSSILKAGNTSLSIEETNVDLKDITTEDKGHSAHSPKHSGDIKTLQIKKSYDSSTTEAKESSIQNGFSLDCSNKSDNTLIGSNTVLKLKQILVSADSKNYGEFSQKETNTSLLTCEDANNASSNEERSENIPSTVSSDSHLKFKLIKENTFNKKALPNHETRESNLHKNIVSVVDNGVTGKKAFCYDIVKNNSKSVIESDNDHAIHENANCSLNEDVTNQDSDKLEDDAVENESNSNFNPVRFENSLEDTSVGDNEMIGEKSVCDDLVERNFNLALERSNDNAIQGNADSFPIEGFPDKDCEELDHDNVENKFLSNFNPDIFEESIQDKGESKILDNEKKFSPTTEEKDKTESMQHNSSFTEVKVKKNRDTSQKNDGEEGNQSSLSLNIASVEDQSKDVLNNGTTGNESAKFLVLIQSKTNDMQEIILHEEVVDNDEIAPGADKVPSATSSAPVAEEREERSTVEFEDISRSVSHSLGIIEEKRDDTNTLNSMESTQEENSKIARGPNRDFTFVQKKDSVDSEQIGPSLSPSSSSAITDVQHNLTWKKIDTYISDVNAMKRKNTQKSKLSSEHSSNLSPSKTIIDGDRVRAIDENMETEDGRAVTSSGTWSGLNIVRDIFVKPCSRNLQCYDDEPEIKELEYRASAE